MVDMGILPNIMTSPSPECYTTFWRIAMYSETLHLSEITQILDPVTDHDLIHEFDVLPDYERIQ